MDDLLATLQGASGQQPSAPPAPAQQQTQQPAFDPTKTYGTPAKLLDNLNHTESSGNAYAVNDKTGAMGPYQFLPSTVAMLRKQGIKFDPFDPQEARAAADYYIQQLKQQNGGTYQGALKAYGGFVHAAPTQYVSKVMAGVPDAAAAPAPTIPGQSNSGQQPAPDNGPMSDLFSTLQAGTQASQKLAKQPAPQAPAQPHAATQQPSTPQMNAAETAGMAQDFTAGGTPVLPGGTVGQAAAGLADTALSLPGMLAQQGDFAVRRAFQQSPQQAQQASQADFGGSIHPIGNLLGVTNTPGYQNEASQRLSNLVGQKVGLGVNAVANATGLPQQDVSNMAGSLSMLVPGAVKGVAKAVAPMVRNVASVAGDAAMETAADDANVRPQAPAAPTAPPMQDRAMVGGGAASTNMNPYPVLTGEENSRGPFPQVKVSKIAQDVTPQEQSVRSKIATEILGDQGDTVRAGVVTGNENALRDEYAAAKSPIQTPGTMAMKQQIANEQEALSNYAQKRIDATGASPNILTNEERGRVINDAIYGPEDSLTSYLRDTKRAIYDEAQRVAGDNPIKTTHIDTLLADPQFQAGVKLSGNEGTVAGAADLIQLARTTGFRDPVSGDMYAPNSVAAWDAVRKAINSEWSPSNRNVVRQLNGAIDKDIAATGGQEMYKLGDRIHQVEQTLLDSKGIGSVLGEYDDNGVKTGPSLESIPPKLNNMPMDQWQHIHDTLDDLSRGQIRGAPDGMPPVPQGVMDAAAQARNEMNGALARSVYEAGASKAGVWNQNSVNKVLNSSVGQKIVRNFSPDEVQAFHTLNYGGQIMPGVHSYEGAGNQLARLAKPGFVEKYAPSVGVNAGHLLGAATQLPGMRWLGSVAGERVGRKLSDLAETRRGQKQYTQIMQEMRKNAQLGKQQP
jgi:hypothetical protein